VPDDELESLMAELRAIEFWDRMPESTVRINEIDRTGGFEARRIRRLEIIAEIEALQKKRNEADKVGGPCALST
jgi:hypothetical protein